MLSIFLHVIIALILLVFLISFLVDILKPNYPYNQAFIFDRGNHYVRYPDGERSMCMPLKHAKTYASLFGGKVYRQEDKKYECK